MLIAMLLAPVLAGAAPVQSQTDLTMQAGNAVKAADAAMNAQYRQTMAAMKAIDALGPQPDATTGPSYQNALLAAQRAWLAYRDAECVVEGYEFRGGSAAGMARGQCIADLTRARTKELRIEMWPK